MATDYISREAAIEIICGQCAFKDACDAGVEPRCSYYIRMTQIPAADVRPIVRGKWIVSHDFDSYQLLQCDQCNSMMWNHEKEVPNFCYNCGADMREVKVDG